MRGASATGLPRRLGRIARRRDKREGPEPTPTASYRDEEGNELVLRTELSAKTIKKIGEGPSSAAASGEDAWARRQELLFERLAVSWEIAGLPLEDQKMLLGRYRMADSETQQWVRETMAAHVERHFPGRLE